MRLHTLKQRMRYYIYFKNNSINVARATDLQKQRIETRKDLNRIFIHT